MKLASERKKISREIIGVCNLKTEFIDVVFKSTNIIDLIA